MRQGLQVYFNRLNERKEVNWKNNLAKANVFAAGYI